MVINNRHSPAGAIRDQFLKAQEELKKDPALMPAWLPILQLYGPSLLTECENHIALSQELVSKWLGSYMFKDDPQRSQKAKKIARYLADDRRFRSHARRVGINDLRALGVRIIDTATEPNLHGAIQELYVSILITFQGTGAYKMFESSEGAALIKVVQVQEIQVPVIAPQQPQPSPDQPVPQPSRAERRRRRKEK